MIKNIIRLSATTAAVIMVLFGVAACSSNRTLASCVGATPSVLVETGFVDRGGSGGSGFSGSHSSFSSHSSSFSHSSYSSGSRGSGKSAGYSGSRSSSTYSKSKAGYSGSRPGHNAPKPIGSGSGISGSHASTYTNPVTHTVTHVYVPTQVGNHYSYGRYHFVYHTESYWMGLGAPNPYNPYDTRNYTNPFSPFYHYHTTIYGC